jgi:PAS domain-containing protein
MSQMTSGDWIHAIKDVKIMNDQKLTRKELIEEIRGLRKAIKIQEVLQAQASETNLIASAMDAILAIDEDQNIVQFNMAAEHIFGYKAEEVLGKSVDLLVPEHCSRSSPQTFSKLWRERSQPAQYSFIGNLNRLAGDRGSFSDRNIHFKGHSRKPKIVFCHCPGCQ